MKHQLFSKRDIGFIFSLHKWGHSGNERSKDVHMDQSFSLPSFAQK